ncbi:hypothetical protein EYZ11_011030 [Aspergillus tanneri]|uniref:Uncharacterized protein n=1 Tax=Aspergillus tanneri TaxID=1220188 RepID=A0A4S3J455_9EURO|nr:uncharacterized protein ATNIH1004_011788 [Aspergillus tanneri]KAA8641652.1 hypothetical protein ATNIH1004_011788 [Aspergillus tanneri]THC89515.1 hypothetical protein EYZ11_011030 [Aspergillus tanneri]
MSSEGSEKTLKLVHIEKPPTSIDSLLTDAEADVSQRAKTLRTCPPLSKILPPDKSVVKLMDSYFANYSLVLSEASARAGTELKVIWDTAILEAGFVNLPNIFTFVIVRFFEMGKIKVEAEHHNGSQLVDWADGPIAIIKNARRIRITGTGKLIGSFVSYEMPSPPAP